jgi:DNA-binding NarL/FixJ family response regulator
MIRVLLVDDQPLVRTGLKMILGSEDGIEVAGECADGTEVSGAVERLRPNLVIMDIRMRGMDGVEATRQLRANPDAPPVLVLTTFDDDEILSAALRAGASGFQLKDAPPEDLVRAVRVVAAGGASLDPAVMGRVLAVYRTSATGDTEPAERLADLTPREMDVLRLMARGANNQEIADELVVGEATIKTHVGRIFEKLEVRDRAAAIVLAFDHGIVRPGGV